MYIQGTDLVSPQTKSPNRTDCAVMDRIFYFSVMLPIKVGSETSVITATLIFCGFLRASGVLRSASQHRPPVDRCIDH